MSVGVEQDIEQILNAYAEAKNRQDVSAAVELFHPDGYYESVGLPGRVQGHEALTAFYTQFFQVLPDYQGEFDGRAFDGDTAVVWGRFTGTINAPLFDGASMGCRVEVPVTFVCTFRDGLVYSDTGYFDPAALYRQAGLQIPSIEALTQASAYVARFADRWSAKEPEEFRDLLHRDVSSLYPGMTEPAGEDGVIEWVKSAIEMFPDLKLDVTRWALEGDCVFIEFDVSATVGGEALNWHGADRFRLLGDQAIEGRSYFDTAPLQSALEAAATAG